MLKFEAKSYKPSMALVVISGYVKKKLLDTSAPPKWNLYFACSGVVVHFYLLECSYTYSSPKICFEATFSPDILTVAPRLG